MDKQEIETLEKKIKEKSAVVMILGLGQVGIPTALSFLESGYKVVGYDINKKIVDKLSSGISTIPESGFGEIISRYLKSGTFFVTDKFDTHINVDILIICVATPLVDNGSNADLESLNKAVSLVAAKLDVIKLIIVESTIPPGTMKYNVIPKLEQISGKTCGMDFLVSFCPERVSPGNALNEFLNNDRIVGADDRESSRLTFELLSRVTRGKIYQTDFTTAEISKLAENSYRDVNIAFANELALICKKQQVDVFDVIKVANTHPRVNIHQPGPGVGGPCLPKDPYLLLTNFKPQNSVIMTARTINDLMPAHLVNFVLSKIDGTDKQRDEFVVLVLGCTYKPDVNDTRNSPARSLISKLMEARFKEVVVHDPYSEESFGAKFTADLTSALSGAKCVILATAHSSFRNLQPKMFRKDCIIVDPVRVLNKDEFINSGFDYNRI